MQLLNFTLDYGHCMGFPDGSVIKNAPASGGDVSLIPGSGRSPGEGNGNPLQYCCLGNPMDRGAWWATVHRVAKSQTGPSARGHTHMTFVLHSELLLALPCDRLLGCLGSQLCYIAWLFPWCELKSAIARLASLQLLCVCVSCRWPWPSPSDGALHSASWSHSGGSHSFAL